MSFFIDIVSSACRHGASDIHLKAGGPPVLRIDGALQTLDLPPTTEAQMGEVLDTVLQHRSRSDFDRDCEADVALMIDGLGRFRANVYKQRGEPCVALRHVKDRVPTFAELNLPKEVMEDLAAQPDGLVLLSGPTGSGKSTALAALVERINATARRHIVTFEDPIEYLFADNLSIIEQREVGLDTRDFRSALRRVVRQDPDVVVVGEVRDAESFEAALGAADTGHLVLATVHAHGVKGTVERMMDLFAPHHRDAIRRQMGHALRAIVSMKLVPARDGGRLPALEILRNNDTVRKLFQRDQLDQVDTVMRSGAAEDMRLFDQSLHALVRDGKITKETALAEASNPDQLAMNLRGIFATDSRVLKPGSVVSAA